MEVESVMDRKKVAGAIHAFLDAGVELLQKPKYNQDDHAKMKVMRTMGMHIGSAVQMVHLETVQQKLVLVCERMKQLGYDEPKQLKQ